MQHLLKQEVTGLSCENTENMLAVNVIFIYHELNFNTRIHYAKTDKLIKNECIFTIPKSIIATLEIFNEKLASIAIFCKGFSLISIELISIAEENASK